MSRLFFGGLSEVKKDEDLRASEGVSSYCACSRTFIYIRAGNNTCTER